MVLDAGGLRHLIEHAIDEAVKTVPAREDALPLRSRRNRPIALLIGVLGGHDGRVASHEDDQANRDVRDETGPDAASHLLLSFVCQSSDHVPPLAFYRIPLVNLSMIHNSAAQCEAEWVSRG